MKATQRKQILVVEDDHEIMDLIADILQSSGHHVDTASDGQVALGKIEGRSYDLIVSDVKMPKVDGPALFGVLTRRQPALSQRILFITGSAGNPAIAEFLSRTGRPWLAKPFRPYELCREVDRMLEADRVIDPSA